MDGYRQEADRAIFELKKFKNSVVVSNFPLSPSLSRTQNPAPRKRRRDESPARHGQFQQNDGQSEEQRATKVPFAIQTAQPNAARRKSVELLAEVEDQGN